MWIKVKTTLINKRVHETRYLQFERLQQTFLSDGQGGAVYEEIKICITSRTGRMLAFAVPCLG